MIGRLNHVAIAVRDIAKASEVYRKTLGAEVSAVVPQPAHGVNTVFITLPNTKIELLEPLGAESPIAKFLERNPDGGIHHVCYEVDDIMAVRDQLKAQGARVLGDGNPKIGAHNKPVLFLHPKDFCGTLSNLSRPDAGYDRDRDLLPDLVDRAVRGAAVGSPGAGRAWGAGLRSGRSYGAQASSQAHLDHAGGRPGVGSGRTRLCEGVGHS